MALFPPGKVGGQSVDYGYKGKGVTNHLLVDGNGMPLSATTTSASVSEREQVYPLLQRVRVYHGYGRPKHCPKEIHADKGYDSKALRIFLRSKGIKPNIPKRTWKSRKQPPGKRTPASTSRWQVERLLGCRENTEDWSIVGKDVMFTGMDFYRYQSL
ncbi:MAG: transposase [Parachlamydia sp.]|nr:transposase [Parachlamydia sp.]